MEVAHGLGLGGQSAGLRHRQFRLSRGKRLAGGLELLLKGRHTIHDLGRLSLEAIPQLLHHRIALVQISEHSGTSDGFNPADTGSNATFRNDLEQADLSGVGHVGAAAELHRHTGHVDHPHHIGVLLTEHRHGTGRLGLIDRHLLHLQRMGLVDPTVDQGFNLLQLIRRHRRGAVEVESQAIEIHQ